MKPFIETYTGKTFSPMSPIVADICIEDIAHALSNQCRFSGHTKCFYSVAQHSVHVARRLAQCGCDNDVCLWGLLHDASEAYLVDLPTPLKMTAAIGKPYRKVEARVMKAVCKRFGLPAEEPKSVKRADLELLATEVRDLMHGDRPYWKKIKALPLPQSLWGWTSDNAKQEFLRLFQKSGGK